MKFYDFLLYQASGGLFRQTILHSFIHSFSHLFIHLFIHSFIPSFIHSFIHSFRFDADRNEVARALSNIQQNHPGIGVAIKTRHAAQILVHKAEEQVRDLKHRGLIDDNQEGSFKV